MKEVNDLTKEIRDFRKGLYIGAVVSFLSVMIADKIIKGLKHS